MMLFSEIRAHRDKFFCLLRSGRKNWCTPDDMIIRVVQVTSARSCSFNGYCNVVLGQKDGRSAQQHPLFNFLWICGWLQDGISHSDDVTGGCKAAQTCATTSVKKFFTFVHISTIGHACSEPSATYIRIDSTSSVRGWFSIVSSYDSLSSVRTTKLYNKLYNSQALGISQRPIERGLSGQCRMQRSIEEHDSRSFHACQTVEHKDLLDLHLNTKLVPSHLFNISAGYQIGSFFYISCHNHQCR